MGERKLTVRGNYLKAVPTSALITAILLWALAVTFVACVLLGL